MAADASEVLCGIGDVSVSNEAETVKKDHREITKDQVNDDDKNGNEVDIA